MKLLLLHLSDLHFQSSPGDNPAAKRSREIAAAVGSLFVQPDLVTVVVSGDIAFAGIASEYAAAASFFDELSGQLAARLNGTTPVYLFVPGNHDCDFEMQTALREIVLQEITARQFDSSVVDTCVQVQTHFWEFLDSRADAIPLVSPGDRAFRIRRITAKNGSIQFNLLNTALLSRLSESQGSLLFPPELLQAAIVDEGLPPSVTVSILHHPYNWFESSNARAIKKELEASSDIILTGHEHEYDAFHVSRHPGEEVEYIEGAVLQDPHDPDSSGFNILLVDTETGAQHIHHFLWHKASRHYQSEAASDVPFVRNAQRLRNQYLLRSTFEQDLVDPGATFTHSAKMTITLDDIFVYPDLRILSTPGQDQGEATLVRDGLTGFLAKRSHVMLLGPDKSGKTTLSKEIFLDLRKRGILPLLLSGNDIKKPDDASTKALVAETYSRQYASPDFTDYSQLPPSRRAIIVDDSHLIRSSARGRDQIIRHLEGIAEIVILIGEDSCRFDDLLNPHADLRIWTYTACQILPLGNLKRSNLIQKWVFLGRGVTVDEGDLLRQAQTTERVVSDLIGRAAFPSYPLFILVVLQQLEVNRRLTLTSQSGSYGFLYESLLTNALARASQLRLDLDTQYSYLAELAFFLFQNRVSSASSGPLYEWHKQFCEDYGRRLDLELLVSSFVSAGVLVGGADQIAFKYPYLYYYFVARYFAQHLGQEPIHTHISQMAVRLHHEESANVLLFLTYLSKDPFILESIISTAERLFADHPDCDIDRDTSFLGPFLAHIPKLVLEAGDPEARRKRLLAEKDERELADKDSASEELLPYDEIETDDALDDILKINVAFKTIQMLGQVLRNYPGSLRASEKKRIAQQAFSLGLRVLHVMMTALEQNKEDVAEILHSLVQERYPQWHQARIRAKIGEVVLNLAEGVTFVVVKQVADSTGDESLAVTFDQILSETHNISYKYIDLSIRLFYFPQFPESQTFLIKKEVYKKAFPAQILNHLVRYRFLLYHTRFDIMRSVCARLGIEISPALIANQRPKLLPRA